MPALRFIRAARRAALRPAAASLALVLVAAGCGAARTTEDRASQQAITFENNSTDLVRVYVVSDAGEWPIGRVLPGETARLRLPPGFTNPDETVSISAIPLGKIGPNGTRLMSRDGWIVSQRYPLRQLLASRWGMTGRQITTSLY